MLNTFSTNILKKIEENPNFQLNELAFISKTDETTLGQELHKLIYYFIKKFDIEKIENSLDKKRSEIWNNLKKTKILDKDFIYVEQSFLIKLDKYFLDGRFDAIYKEDDFYTIIDWKTKNLPKNPESDIQTIVYLYCASKLLKTNKIKMRYIALESLQESNIEFSSEKEYKKRILEIIKKYTSQRI